MHLLLQNEYGLDLQGGALFTATGISADGRAIAGSGTRPDGFGVATLSEPTPPGTAAVYWSAVSSVAVGREVFRPVATRSTNSEGDRNRRRHGGDCQNFANKFVTKGRISV